MSPEQGMFCGGCWQLAAFVTDSFCGELRPGEHNGTRECTDAVDVNRLAVYRSGRQNHWDQ